jgi:hypothetical protein
MSAGVKFFEPGFLATDEKLWECCFHSLMMETEAASRRG